MEEIIKTANLKKVYGLDTPYPKTALNGVSISVNKGTFACIMGTSGSGKTTLINILSTIDEATSGKLLIFDQNIVGLSDKEKANIRKRYMGFIFQDFNLLDTLTAYENIALALQIQNFKAKAIEQQIKVVARKLDIEDILNKYPYEMSGGQKQRVASARAIVTNPKLVLADEPTGALDSKSSKMLLERLQRLNQDYQTTILMVTHDAYSASYAKQVYMLSDGAIKCRLNHSGERQKFYDEILSLLASMGSEQE